MNIAQLITPKVFTAYLLDTHTVRQALEIMQNHHFMAMPVLDKEGKYLGVVSEGDFLRHILSSHSSSMRVQEHYRLSDLYRKDNCQPLHIQASMQQVTEVLLRQNFVPIVDDRGYFCGIVTRRTYIEWISQLAAPHLTDMPAAQLPGTANDDE